MVIRNKAIPYGYTTYTCLCYNDIAIYTPELARKKSELELIETNLSLRCFTNRYVRGFIRPYSFFCQRNTGLLCVWYITWEKKYNHTIINNIWSYKPILTPIVVYCDIRYNLPGSLTFLLRLRMIRIIITGKDFARTPHAIIELWGLNENNYDRLNTPAKNQMQSPCCCMRLLWSTEL